MIRRWGEQIIKKQQYAATLALIFAFLSFFDLPVGWISSVIVGLVTLQNGPKRGGMVLAWAILPAVAMLCLGNYGIFFNVLICHYLLAMGFATMLRRQDSWMSVLQAAALLGVLAVAGVFLFAPEIHTWLVAQIDFLLRESQNASSYKIPPAIFDVWLNNVNLIATGLVADGLLLFNLLTVFIGRKWQAEVTAGINLKKEGPYLRSSYLASLLLAVIAGGLFIDGALFLNILVVAVIPFIVSGLSLVHNLSASKKNGQIFMIIFYGLILFMVPYMVLLLTTLGWLDSFVNFRKIFIVEKAVEE